MKIGVKYCGGCNPQLKRKQLVDKLKRRLAVSFTSCFSTEEELDLLLIVNGCHVGCASKFNDYEFPTINIRGFILNGNQLSKEELIKKVNSQILDMLNSEVTGLICD
ncbi:hypothetical protein [Halanaerobaculum tunisiense]